MAAGQAIEIVNMAGLGAGMLTMALPPVSKGLNSLSKKYPKLVFPIMMIPTAIGYVASIVASFPIMAWAAKTQVGASRQGRFEAMRKDLNNPNSFAVLTDEQLKQAQNDAQNITISEENEKKDLINLGFKDVFKNLKKLRKSKTQNRLKKRKNLIFLNFFCRLSKTTKSTNNIKKQKKASRVADMLAIKDLNDYRHFVDYNNLSNASAQPESTELTGGIKAVNKPQSLLEQLNNKYKEM